MALKSVDTSEQVRRRIDAGETGEKVGASDPAAAPLGADDEAGGRPPSVKERELAARDQIKIEPPPSGLNVRSVAVSLVGAVIVAAIGFLLWKS